MTQKENTRSAEQWLDMMGEGAGIIRHHVVETVKNADNADIPKSLACAAKEARRLLSDIYQFGEEVHGVSEDEIDSVGPL